jgi:hypothetical protein
VEAKPRVVLKPLVLCVLAHRLRSPALGRFREVNARALPARSAQLNGKPSRPGGEREMISWVVLANTYVELKLDTLRQKLDELYPGQFLPQRLQGNFAVLGPAPGHFLIQCHVTGVAGAFMLNNIRGFYTDFAEAIADPSLRREAESQCCWLSIDLVHMHTTDEEAYRFIGQVLAKLAPADAAFLVHPARRATIAFDDNVRRRLANGENILSSPVTPISPDPPRR